MAVATAKTAGNGKPGPKHNIEAMRQDYYARIDRHGMKPLSVAMVDIEIRWPLGKPRPAKRRKPEPAQR